MHRLLSMDERTASLLVREAGRSIPEGIPKLVHALVCERPSISVTSRNVLLRLLDDWQSERNRDQSGCIGQLAEELARNSDEIGSTAHQQAIYVVDRILRSPIDDRVVDPERLVANCEKVLRAHSEIHRIASARLDGIVELPDHQAPRIPDSTDKIQPISDGLNGVPIHEQQFALPGGAISVVPGTLPMPDPGQDSGSFRR